MYLRKYKRFAERESDMGDSSEDNQSEDGNPTVNVPPVEPLHGNDDDVDFDEALIPTISDKKSAEILIEIDQDRKKVITLNGGDGYDSLVELFFKAVADDPGLKQYANSTFVFQIFSEKFSTWIDLDRSKELVDGSHLKTIFLTQTEPSTKSGHKYRQSSKRTQGDSSDNCGDDNCKCKASCSSDDCVRIKRICQPMTACVSGAEENSVTCTVSVCGNGSTDVADSSQQKHVSESHAALPISQGLFYQLLIITISRKNCRHTSVGFCTRLYLKIHILKYCVLNKCFFMDSIHAAYDASYPRRKEF
jgi:hypothetical protein